MSKMICPLLNLDCINDYCVWRLNGGCPSPAETKTVCEWREIAMGERKRRKRLFDGRWDDRTVCWKSEEQVE